MLIQFNFKNFKSFRNEASLDLSAAKMTEFSDRVVSEGNDKILPMAAIYGANASGKSNIYNAFEYMADYVVESFKYGDEEEKFEEYRPTPFLFDSVSNDAESFYSVFYIIYRNSMKASLLHNRQNTFKNYVFYVWHNIGTKLSQTGTSLRFTA